MDKYIIKMMESEDEINGKGYVIISPGTKLTKTLWTPHITNSSHLKNVQILRTSGLTILLLRKTERKWWALQDTVPIVMIRFPRMVRFLRFMYLKNIKGEKSDMN